MKKYLVLFVSIFMVSFFPPGFVSAEMSNTELEQEIKALKEKLEKDKGSTIDALKSINELISISGCIEIEAGQTKGYEDEDESDITLATVELGIDVDLNDWITGHILLLWEEDDTESVDLDEGTITLGNLDKFPLYLTAGKMYVPFGNFESSMISDPLTLEIAETRESALLVGFEQEGFSASIYAFNGDIDEDGDDNEVKCYGANAGYGFENDDIGLDIGIGWMNSIADSDGIGDALEDENATLDDYEAGIAAHAVLTVGHLYLIGEYIAALDDIDYNAYDDSGAFLDTDSMDKPKAWNIEAGYTMDVQGRETTFAIAYQGTDDMWGALPEEKYLVSAGVALAENVGLAVEYAHAEDYDEDDGGTDDDEKTITVQLSLEF